MKIVLTGTLMKIGSESWNSGSPYAEISNVVLNSTGDYKTHAKIPLTDEEAKGLAPFLFQTIRITVEPAGDAT